MKNNQRVPTSEGVAILIEKKSKFIGSIFPISSIEQANELLKATQKKYWDANHHCYAYILDSSNVMRYSDDGEPQGTAGMPILELLKKEQVFSVLCVVTRYFGGTLLGAGGLTRAYGNTAKLALDAAGVSELKLFYEVNLICEYNFLVPLRRMYEHFDIKNENVEYGEKLNISIDIESGVYDAFSIKIRDATGGSVTTNIVSEKYFAKKVV